MRVYRGELLRKKVDPVDPRKKIRKKLLTNPLGRVKLKMVDQIKNLTFTARSKVVALKLLSS